MKKLLIFITMVMTTSVFASDRQEAYQRCLQSCEHRYQSITWSCDQLWNSGDSNAFVACKRRADSVRNQCTNECFNSRI